MNKGLIHLYTGDAKGKTTASLGLALRALGHDMKVVLVQFLKGRETGELKSLEKIGNVQIFRYPRDFGFFKSASDEDKAEMTRLNNENLKKALNLVGEGSCDLLILDEVCGAYNNQALDRELVDDLIKDKPLQLELVMTGRNAPAHFIDLADYVSEFVKIKHPFDKGIGSRKGVEY